MTLSHRDAVIVLDASAAVAVVTGSAGEELTGLVANTALHAPHHLDLEVLSALRGLSLSHKLHPLDASRALDAYLALTIERHPVTLLARRIWGLRHQMTTYDAAYLALAEGLGAPLATCDRELLGDHGAPTVEIRCFPGRPPTTA